MIDNTGQEEMVCQGKSPRMEWWGWSGSSLASAERSDTLRGDCHDPWTARHKPYHWIWDTAKLWGRIGTDNWPCVQWM